MTKNEKIDAAVAVIEARCQARLRGELDYAREYTEAYEVATALVEQGVLVREEGLTGYGERARKRLDGQAKRLLDEEAGRPNPRILRFSSRDHVPLPHLDGYHRHLYGNAVGYTTPALYQAAQEAVEARLARLRADEQAMDELLQQAEAAGLPEPVKHDSHLVTYNVEGVRALIERSTP